MMFQPQPFPANRDQLTSLYLSAGQIEAEAVLLAPRCGKRNQKIRLMAGSRFRTREVGSCPAFAHEQRASFLGCGILRLEEFSLVLTKDIDGTLSHTANMVMGASKNGWDFWWCRFGMPIEEAWQTDALVFYDPSTRCPPMRAGVLEPFMIPTEFRGETDANWKTYARSSKTEINVLHLRKQQSLERPAAGERILRCCTGGVTVSCDDDSVELASGHRVILPQGKQLKLHAAENSVVEEILIMRPT